MSREKYTLREYRVGDIAYLNLNELALAAGISYEAAVKRSHRGWSDPEIFYGRGKLPAHLVEYSTITNVNAVTIGGVEYRNIKHAHDEIKPKAKLPAVHARIKRGLSYEQAFELEEKIDGRTNPDLQSKWKLGNKQFKTLREAYDFAQPSVTFNSVRARLRYDWTLEEALEVVEKIDGRKKQNLSPRSRQNPKKRDDIVVDGVKYPSISALARAYDLPPLLVYNRIRDNGWPYDRAVSEDVSNKVVMHGVPYRSALKAWEAVGKTSYSTYEGRRLKGFPLEICLGLDPLPNISTYEVDGKIFGSLFEVASTYGLSLQTLVYRLNNMEIEDAVHYVPSNGRYSKKIFKRDPGLAATTGTLYFIEIKQTDGILHKIGITSRSVNQIFRSNSYAKIAEYKGHLSGLYELEQMVVKKFSNLHYRGDDEFDGRTELFLLLDNEVEEVKKYLSEKSSFYGANIVI